MDRIYLDNAATTPIDERVRDAMLPYLGAKYGNASSVHSFGREAKVLVEDTRDLVAYYLGARPSEIYFTSGATEANNFALKGLAFSRLQNGGSGKQGQIVSSKIEHPSVIETLDYLHNRFGFDITFLKNDKYGIIDLQNLQEIISDDTILICVMHSNNKIGIINETSEIARIASAKNVHVHADMVQSFGKISLKVKELGCSSASISAHKIYGPKGIGALYIKQNTVIDKLLHGGKQERDRRGGTENTANIAGFKKAVELLKDQMDRDMDHYKDLKEKLVKMLKDKYEDKVIFNSVISINQSARGLYNILNFSFDPDKIKTDPDTLLIKLDMKGIAVSSGSACSSGAIHPSHVIKALGHNDRIAAASVRVSFGRFNTSADVDNFVKALIEITG